MANHKPRLEDQLAAILQSSQGEGQCTQVYGSWFSRNPRILISIGLCYIVLAISVVVILNRLFTVLDRPKRSRRSRTPDQSRNAKATGAEQETEYTRERTGRDHLLIVLGSGGHTAEMMGVLHNLGAEYLLSRFGRRTWIVSSGDGFSVSRAREFEDILDDYVQSQARKTRADSYDIVTVHRARNIHQSIYTTPITAVRSLWDCIAVLRGRHRDQKASEVRSTTVPSSSPRRLGNGVPYPDLILTNGPGTAVILLMASILLLIFGYAPMDGQGCMRSIYVESWARVKTLSLSGKILRKCAGVNRFLVQWMPFEDSAAVDLTTSRNFMPGRRKLGDDSLLTSRKIEFVGPVVA